MNVRVNNKSRSGCCVHDIEQHRTTLMHLTSGSSVYVQSVFTKIHFEISVFDSWRFIEDKKNKKKTVVLFNRMSSETPIHNAQRSSKQIDVLASAYGVSRELLKARFDARWVDSRPKTTQNATDGQTISAAAAAVAAVTPAVGGKVSFLEPFSVTSVRSAPVQFDINQRLVYETIELQIPGCYVLRQNMQFIPTKPDQAAILISGDDITLDLNGYTISSLPMVQLNTLGIKVYQASTVTPGLVDTTRQRNVVVKNGKLQHFSKYAISSIGLQNLTLEKIKIRHIGDRRSTIKTSFVTLEGCSKVRISDCSARGLVGLTGYVTGIDALDSSNLLLDCVRVRDIENLGGPASGFAFALCNAVHLTDCTAHSIRTQAGNPTFFSHTCAGFYPSIACSALTFDNCAAHHIYGGADDSHGFPIFDNGFSSVVLRSCVARDIRSGFASPECSGAKSTGFEIDGTSNVLVSRCRAEAVVAFRPENKQCAGFSTGNALNVEFEHCVATNNFVVFDLRDPRYVELDRGSCPCPSPSASVLTDRCKESETQKSISCVKSPHIATCGPHDLKDVCTMSRHLGEQTFAYGFAYAPDPRISPLFNGICVAVRWRKCVATDNDVGFTLFNHSESWIVDCSATSNRAYGLFNPASITISCQALTECTIPLRSVFVNLGVNNLIENSVFWNNGISPIVDLVPQNGNVYRANRSNQSATCCHDKKNA